MIWPVIESDNISQSVSPAGFYPLHFFFCKDPSSALPLNYIKYQDVDFRIKSPASGYNFVIWATFYYLSANDRELVPTEMLITQNQRVAWNNQNDFTNIIGNVKYVAGLINYFLSLTVYDKILYTFNSINIFYFQSSGFITKWSSGIKNDASGGLPTGLHMSSVDGTFLVDPNSSIPSTTIYVCIHSFNNKIIKSFVITAISTPWLSTTNINTLPSIIPQTHATPTQALDLKFSELEVWNSGHSGPYQQYLNIPAFSISGQTTNIIFGNRGGSFIGPVITATGNFVQSSNCLTITTIDSFNLIYATKTRPSDTGGTLTKITYSIPVTGVTITGSGTTATVTVPLYTNGQPQYGHYLNNGTYSGFVITVSGNDTYTQAPGSTITVSSPSVFTYTTSGTITGSAPTVVSIVYTCTTGMTATPILTAAASVLNSPNPSYTSNLIVYASNYWQNEILVAFSSGHPFMIGIFSWPNYSFSGTQYAGMFNIDSVDYYGNPITEQNFVSLVDDFRNVCSTDAGLNDQLGYQREQSDTYKYNMYISHSFGTPYDQGGNPLFWTPGNVSTASKQFPNVLTGSSIYAGDDSFTTVGSYTTPIPSSTSGQQFNVSDLGNALHEVAHIIQGSAGPTGTYAPGVAPQGATWWEETMCESLRTVYYQNKKFSLNPPAIVGQGTCHMENYLMTWVDSFIGGFRHICIYSGVVAWTNSSFQEFLRQRINQNILGIMLQNPISGQDPIDRLSSLTGWTITGLFAEWMYWIINLPSLISLFQYPGWGFLTINQPDPNSPEVNCFTRDRSVAGVITFNTGSNFVKKRWDQFGYFMPVSASTNGLITTLTPKFQYLDRCGFEVINISGNLPAGTTSYTVSFTPVLTNSKFSITGGNYSISGTNIFITGTTISGGPLMGATMNIASSYNNWGTDGGWAYLSNISGSTYTIAFGSGSPLSSLTSGPITSPIIFDTNLNGSSASDWIGVCCVLDATTGACVRSLSQPLNSGVQSQIYTSSEIVVFGISCTNKIPISKGNMLVQFSVGITQITTPPNQIIDTSRGSVSFTVSIPNLSGVSWGWSGTWVSPQLPRGLSVSSQNDSGITFTAAKYSTITTFNMIVWAKNSGPFTSTTSFNVSAAPGRPFLTSPGNQILDTTSGSQTFTVTNSASSGITWTYTNPLPTGLTVLSQSDSNIIFSVDQNSSISPFNLSVTATNGAGSSSVSFSVSAGAKPNLASPGDEFKDSNGANPLFNVINGAPTSSGVSWMYTTPLPSGIYVSYQEDDAITFSIIQYAVVPTFIMTVTATNGGGSSFVSFNVSVGRAPTLINPGNQSLNTSSGPQGFSVRNTSGSNITWTYTDLPAGLTRSSYTDSIINFEAAQHSIISIPIFKLTATNVFGSRFVTFNVQSTG